MNFLKRLFGRKKIVINPYYLNNLMNTNAAAGSDDVEVYLNGELVPEAFVFGFEAREEKTVGAIVLYYFDKRLLKFNKGDNIDVKINFDSGNAVVLHFRNITIEREFGAFEKGQLVIERNIEFSTKEFDQEFIKGTVSVH